MIERRMGPVFAVVLLIAPAAASAGAWRVRAREIFETGRLDLGDGGGRADYRGFSSAFQLGYEEPERYVAGLGVQRGRLRRAGREESVAATAVGLEGKLFPVRAVKPWFLRAAALAEALDPAGPPKDVWTYGLTLGTGWEFPVWRLGLAPEVGGKLLWGSRGRYWRAFYAGLGVHFYVFPGDPEDGR